MRPLFLVTTAALAMTVRAPTGLPTGYLVRELRGCSSNAGTSDSVSGGSIAATGVAAMLSAAAVAATCMGRRHADIELCDEDDQLESKPGRPHRVHLDDALSSDNSDDADDYGCEDAHQSDSPDSADDTLQDEAENGCQKDSSAAGRAGRHRRDSWGSRNGQGSIAAGKLWSLAQFPEGVTGAANWDLANLKAAQDWCCPCTDRRNCIGHERLPVTELYEYRKHFRTSARSDGGFRDACRAELEERMHSETHSFARSFKVGRLIDCCAASAGLAKGLAFASWANSRTDARKGRPYRAGRKAAAAATESVERAHLNAYIRALRESMEGTKGGYEVRNTWRTGSMPLAKRWEQYVANRNQKKLPIIGSQALFAKLWREHAEIQEFKAKGHPKCDR